MKVDTWLEVRSFQDFHTIKFPFFFFFQSLVRSSSRPAGACADGALYTGLSGALGSSGGKIDSPHDTQPVSKVINVFL